MITGESNPTVASKTGRRVDKVQSTRARILDAATRLFLSVGYSQTNLDTVAEEAGVTKPTVYSHFKSKKGLFDAVINRSAEQRIASMGDLLVPTDDPRQDLVRFGDFLLSNILTCEAQRWDRLAASEAMHNPEVGQAFFEAGPQRVLGLITRYLKHQKSEGMLNVPYPARAAEQLIGMFLCLDLLRTQIGHQPPSASQRKRRCREAVDVFLKAYGS